MRISTLAAAAAIVIAPLAANADVIYSGDTTGGPIIARPLSFTGTSGIGSAVPSFSQPFFVDTSGQYIFEVFSADFDTYALVYVDSFDPNATLTNLIAGDDDYTGPFTILPGAGAGLDASRIALGDTTNFGGATTGLFLTAGTQYYAVTTGFANTDFGAFDAGIGDGTGGGTVSLGLVPEPTSMALLGLGGLTLLRRRRA